MNAPEVAMESLKLLKCIWPPSCALGQNHLAVEASEIVCGEPQDASTPEKVKQWPPNLGHFSSKRVLSKSIAVLAAILQVIEDVVDQDGQIGVYADVVATLLKFDSERASQIGRAHN